MTIKAIQTRYKGYNFRSRLEARWAVFFDALCIAWEYEPEGFELNGGVRYLPDFFLPNFHQKSAGRAGIYVEVKPGDFLHTEYEKAFRFCDESGVSVLCLFGTPSPKEYVLFQPAFCDESGEQIGVNSVGASFHRKYLAGGANGGENRLYLCPEDDMKMDISHGVVLHDGGHPIHAFDAARSARFEFGQSGATL